MNNKNVCIRFACENDLENIAPLYVHNHKTTYKGLLSDEYLNSLTVDGARERWQKYLSDSKNKIWIALENNCFLGFVAGTEDPDLENTWYLDSLHICENARGKGVGTRLISEMGRYASKKGYDSMSICVVKGNVNAKTLYLKLGAKPYKSFEDRFGGTPSNSEKLIWKSLDVFGET